MSVARERFCPIAPPPLAPGQKVAVISPSWGGPGTFPLVHERSLRVIADELGFGVVEFPTTRAVGARPDERASDLMAAFLDPEVGAVMASIGGSDEITILRHLDPEVIAAHPKRFFGYSDNTNLLNYLFGLGIVGYHGGSTMVHLARAGGPHPVSLDSLRRALTTSGPYEILPQVEFSELEPEWADPTTWESPTATSTDPGWTWVNADGVVEGVAWGGNLEVLQWILGADSALRPLADYEGCVLVLETSEEMPSAEDVTRMLRVLGERGLLERAGGLVMGKAKAWHRNRPLEPAERERFREDQRAAVLVQLDYYHPGLPAVFGPDIGHTDPQVIVPIGGLVRLDGPARRLVVTY